MVDSGVAWIGEIPEGWKTLSLVYVLRRGITDGPHETPNCLQEGIPFVSVDSLNDTEDVDFSVVKKFISQEDFVEFSRRSKIELGDILFSKAATIGKTAIAKQTDFMVWSPLAIIKPDKEKSFGKYLYHVLNCEGLIASARLSGSMNTQANVGMRELEKVKIPLPPLAEQQHIAAFLDGECAKIDGLRSKIEKQIEKLDELKKSTITETVTGRIGVGGRCRSRKMKPSGVEWIGDIPEEWKVSRVKYEVETRNEVELYDPESDVYIGLENLQPFLSSIIPSNTTYPASNYSLCKKNDLLFSKLRPYLAKCVISPFDAFCTGEFVVINSFSGVVAFLRYWLLADNVLNQIVASTYGAKMPRASESFILNLPMLLPPLAEQKEIAEYLDKKCAAIDAAKEKCRTELDKLAEYKKSLIYEYVTGKREVA